MCFSASGSFGIGGILTAAGIYTAKKAAYKDRHYLPFALFPLLFGVQQISEGFVWIGLLNGYPLIVKVGSLIFTFFALGFWPFFAPFSMLFVEQEERPEFHRALLVLVFLGALVGVYSYLPILTGILPMTTKIVHHSISYDTNFPRSLKDINAAIYLFIVIVPFLAVPSRRIRFFALLLLLSSAIASHFFFGNYVSVWCFFAAVLSLDIAYILKRLPEK